MPQRSVISELAALNRRCSTRSLRLRTPRRGPLDLGDVFKDHVQGVTRFDRDTRAGFALSVSGPRHGELWLAEFALHDGAPSAEGEVVATLRPGLPHPGGLQASGNLLALACEGPKLWAEVEIYDVSQIHAPRLVDKLVLNNSLREGVDQLTRSKAGWLGFARISEKEFLLFVGGKQFGARQGWFYRYVPGAAQPFSFAGPFTGTVTSTSADAWGPQSGAAIVQLGDQAPTLVTFGADGANGLDALHAKMRCFSFDLPHDGPCTLVHEPRDAPAVFRFSAADLSPLFGTNARWGTTAFVDTTGALLTYFTARNPRPGQADVHELEIAEVRGTGA